MAEAEARERVARRLDVPRETMARLDAYVAMLLDAAREQNLISRGSVPRLWERHIADSAQLLTHCAGRRWVDLGSGAGLPGMVLAILSDGAEVALIEPRGLRVAFLRETIARLELGKRVAVIARTAERVAAPSFDTILARALAPLPKIFAAAHHLSTAETVWVLPKGRSAREEVAAARRAWQGDFAIVPSATDSEAEIVIARNVKARRKP